MSTLRLSGEDAARLRALELLQRYSIGLDRVADETLGNRGTDSLDLQILLTIDALRRWRPVRRRRRPRPPAQHGVARARAAAVRTGSSSGPPTPSTVGAPSCG